MAGILRSTCKSVATCGLKSLTFTSASKSHHVVRCFSVSTNLKSTILPGLKYTEHHEWVKKDGNVFTVGITDHAQSELGDLAYCELPEVDSEVTAGEPCGTIESVKAVSELFSPLSGTVKEINEQIADSPAVINSSPYEDGWLFKVEATNAEEVDALMDEGAYKEFCESHE